MLGNKDNQPFAHITCSSHCAETGWGKTIAGFVPEPAKSCLLGTESLLPWPNSASSLKMIKGNNN